MHFDSVVIQESNTEGFYPVSLSTPIAAMIIGGLRYYENLVLWLINMGLEPEIYIQTRKYLSDAWNKINKSILMSLGIKFKLHFINALDEAPHGTSLLISTLIPPSIDLISKLISRLSVGVAFTCNGRVIMGLMKNGEFINTINYCPNDLLNGVWTIAKLNTELLTTNLSYLTRVIGDKNIDSEISHGAVVNEDKGPVFTIRSIVEPLTYIRGPALLGPSVHILPHAYVREGSVFYMDNAVGGEVKNSIMDHDSLKEHHGYLGDSYVGRWVNLGAGSVTSNLKNTIGFIKYAGYDTGMIKLGSIIGDWVKVGINTSIMSGKFIGQGSSVLGLVRKDVPPFSICIDNDCNDYALDKAIVVYERFAKLRHKEPSESEEELIREVYKLKNSISINPP